MKFLVFAFPVIHLFIDWNKRETLVSTTRLAIQMRCWNRSEEQQEGRSIV
jgi:hypothetical protein